MKKRIINSSTINGQRHVVPIHTNVVNNHIYKHTYVPEYTCSEENVVTNVNECGQNSFMNNGF